MTSCCPEALPALGVVSVLNFTMLADVQLFFILMCNSLNPQMFTLLFFIHESVLKPDSLVSLSSKMCFQVACPRVLP